MNDKIIYQKKCLDNNFSPIYRDGQLFIWKAEYDDGTYVYEFDDNKKETNFNELNQDKISKFYLVGNGGFIWFSMEDGIIHLDGDREINIKFINNKEYNITNLGKDHYTEVEQYKRGECFFSGGQIESNPTLRPCEHFIGYKGNRILLGKDILYFRVIFSLDTKGNPYKLKIGLSSTNTYNNSKLVITYGNSTLESDELNLKRDGYYEYTFEL